LSASPHLIFQTEKRHMATTEQVQRAVRRVPFTPFTIHIADGRSYLVKRPEQVAVAGGRELVFIGDDEGFHEIAMINITEIHSPSPAAKDASGKTQKGE
jgi:hypothetical protein